MPPRPSAVVQEEFNRFIPKIVDPQATLDLIVGRPRVLTFAEFATRPQVKLYLPDDEIVRWDILSETEVALVGQQPGSTVLTIWLGDPEAENGRRVLSYLVRVHEDPEFRATLADLEQQINDIFPDSYVQLSIVRDRLVVRGQAKDAVEAGQIVTLLAQTRGQRGETATGEAPTLTQVEAYFDQDKLALEELAAERRSILDATAVEAAGIVNLLKIPGEQQVSLKVTVAEVNRSALRSIGADARVGGTGDVSFLSLFLPNNFTATTGGNLSVNTPDFRLALNALRTLGYARTLAEPNLTALNGRPAVFRAGDTFPVPAAQAGFGGVGQGVQQQFVGVQVQFVPYLVDRDRIRLQVRGQVSARDDTQAANIGGTAVPGQNTRDFATTVELRDGETLALAGLLQTTLQGEADRVPFVGDVPILGSIFSNKSTTATEQELVVLVTPELTRPLPSAGTPALPGADVFEPTDHEFFLGNRLESRRAQDFRSPVRTDYHRLHYVQKHCVDRYIIGPVGQTYGRPANDYAPAAYQEERGARRTLQDSENLPPPRYDATDAP